LALAGCAGVSVTPLNPDGLTKARGAEPGLRYYMPMPYLLVTEIPPTAAVKTPDSGEDNGQPNANDSTTADAPVLDTNNLPDGARMAPGATAPADGGAGSKTNTADSSTNSMQSTAGGSSNTSFGATTPQYVIKLIYLPDKTHPLAMNESTGLFGTAEMKPVLQDGWMLTSLDATADSKTAETLTAAAALVGAAMTGKTTAPAATAKTAPGSGPGTKPTAQTPADLSIYYKSGTAILRPGLYRFEYDETTGALIGLKPVEYFTGNGIVWPNSNRPTREDFFTNGP
jgi:hypothetical protein